jgi:hypothetical protein
VTGERTQRTGNTDGAGYLCFQSAAAAEWGALLIVGATGLPVEFLYSGPLRPTPVQAILYQDRLGPEVRLSLVRALLRAMKCRPHCVVVAGEEALPEVVEELSLPLLALTADGSEWLRPPDGEALRTIERLEQTLGVAEPVGRARAALAYVVEYEATRARGGEAGG